MKIALFYSFLAIFVVTSIVTLLGVVKFVEIDEQHLNKLVIAFLIELAGAVILVYKKADFFIEDKLDKDTNPLQSINVDEHNVLSSIDGIVGFYETRASLSPQWWQNEFFNISKKPDLVLLMSQSMLPTFDNDMQCETFVKWCQAGTKMRLLMLSPTPREISQIVSVGQGMHNPLGNGDPLRYLPVKIRKSIDLLHENVIDKIHDLDKKPQVRYAHCNLPYCLNVVDGDMYVTFYGTRSEGNSQPTLHISGKTTEAFKAFKQEFERIWTENSSIYPYEDPVLNIYRKNWPNIINLKHLTSHFPPPRQAILFISYRCSQKCPYCMFRSAHSENAPEMGRDSFVDIVNQLVNFNVSQLEISGGGEPLEHSQIEQLIQFLSEKATVKGSKSIQTGLLTNGMQMPVDPSKLIRAFNDYIRLSLCHEAFSGVLNEEYSEQYKTWLGNLNDLLKAKRRLATSNTNIGIKILLTNDNIDTFVETIRVLLENSAVRSVDHLRLRSSPSVPPNRVAEIEKEVYHIIQNAKLREETISLNMMPFRFPRNFHCWISPIQVAITPEAEVFSCCNFFDDKHDRSIGVIDQHNSFENIWNSNNHQTVRQKLVGKTCGKYCYSNCRYAELQTILDPITLQTGTS